MQFGSRVGSGTFGGAGGGGYVKKRHGVYRRQVEGTVQLLGGEELAVLRTGAQGGLREGVGSEDAGDALPRCVDGASAVCELDSVAAPQAPRPGRMPIQTAAERQRMEGPLRHTGRGLLSSGSGSSFHTVAAL